MSGLLLVYFWLIILSIGFRRWVILDGYAQVPPYVWLVIDKCFCTRSCQFLSSWIVFEWNTLVGACVGRGITDGIGWTWQQTGIFVGSDWYVIVSSPRHHAVLCGAPGRNKLATFVCFHAHFDSVVSGCGWIYTRSSLWRNKLATLLPCWSFLAAWAMLYSWLIILRHFVSVVSGWVWLYASSSSRHPGDFCMGDMFTSLPVIWGSRGGTTTAILSASSRRDRAGPLRSGLWAWLLAASVLNIWLLPSPLVPCSCLQVWKLTSLHRSCACGTHGLHSVWKFSYRCPAFGICSFI